MSHDRIVAVGLLTEQDLDRLGETFTRLWPVGADHCFDEILEAIDEAERQLIVQRQDPAAKSSR